MKRSVFALFLVLALLLAGCTASGLASETAQIPAGSQPTESTPPPADKTEPTPIPAESALDIALAHAKAARADARDIDVELDRKGSTLIYEVGFEVGQTEYDYEIDAATGGILHSRVDAPKPAPTQPKPTEPAPTQAPAPEAPAGLSAEGALEIALAHAGAARTDARDVEIDRDMERGVPVFEVEFDAGAYEYEYEINAATGAILKAEKEPRD